MEIARRLVAAGDTVEWFTAAFPQAPPDEAIEGVRLVRVGRQWTVHWHAFRRYRRRIRQDFDAVIDEVNTFPFFTPLWAGIPVFMLIHQLAREVWWYESRFPLSLVGFALEPLYLRLYTRVKTFTISQSTKSDLLRLGLKGPITILPIGVETITAPAARKTTTPTFLYVGRLAASKRIKDIVQAFALFHRNVGFAALWLIGNGPRAYEEELRELARRLGVFSDVHILGRVSTAEKHRRMAEAHMLLMTSVREGWGLAVTEANACGTPAVVYDVGGLRDAVQHEVTGLVVPPRPSELATAMLRLWTDTVLYDKLRAEALRRSSLLSFDTSATILRDAIASSLPDRPALEGFPSRLT
jgi:glycosyltransferase involved in cell wall biosynthesis